MIPSLRFLPLRTGTASEGALTYYVLDMLERYPVGSVTRFDHSNLPRSNGGTPFPFYLVHSGEGFYALAWPGDLVHGYKDCDVTYDVSVRQFSCSNGARWALDGAVLAKPGVRYRDDPLAVLSVRISLNGQVLVSPSVFLSGIADDLRLTGAAVPSAILRCIDRCGPSGGHPWVLPLTLFALFALVGVLLSIPRWVARRPGSP
jgi:hypothetical protein